VSGRKLLLDGLLEKEVRDLWYLFDTTNQKYGTLRGIRFEAYAHKKILTHGIDGMARLITKDVISATSTKRVVIPAGSTLYALSSNNLDAFSRCCAAVGDNTSSQGTYLLPSFCNFPVIDSAYVFR
jgi:hypothetical protein